MYILQASNEPPKASLSLAGTAGVHSLPDELLIRVFSLVIPNFGVDVPPACDGMLRSTPLWLPLVCKRWRTLLSGPSNLFANFCVELHRLKDAASNSTMRVLLARLRGARALKICCGCWEEPLGPPDGIFVRLLCNLDNLPVLDSLYIELPEPFDLTSELELGIRRIAQLSSLRSLHLEGLKYHELQLLQGYSALSCLTCLHLGLREDDVPVQHTVVLPSFVLQLRRLQTLTLWDPFQDARYLLPKVDPVARLLVSLM